MANEHSKRTVGKQVPTPRRKQMTARVAGWNEHAVNPSATKSGPGRYAKHGKPGSSLDTPRPIRAYVALMAAWAQKRVTKAPLRDEHGAYTVVGRKTASNGETIKRMWLAGISAQRGY